MPTLPESSVVLSSPSMLTRAGPPWMYQSALSSEVAFVADVEFSHSAFVVGTNETSVVLDVHIRTSEGRSGHEGGGASKQ